MARRSPVPATPCLASLPVPDLEAERSPTAEEVAHDPAATCLAFLRIQNALERELAESARFAADSRLGASAHA